MFVKQKDHHFDAAATRERAISAVKPGKEVRFKRQTELGPYQGELEKRRKQERGKRRLDA